MKIPETTANVGAYYGNEENGQWQPNGVIIDSGVGGGVVGSGDAGVHRPPVYPLHIPRGHVPAPAGYVMAGAYYPAAPYAPPAPVPADFEDYMWMENEEEFDKQVMQQLEEEALMEQCIEAMLEDEQRERQQRPVNGHNHHYPTTSGGSGGAGGAALQAAVSRSTLNPLAAEFVPTRTATTSATTPATQPTEERQDPEVQATEEAPQKTTDKTTAETTSIEPQTTTTEPTPEPSEPTKTEEIPSQDPPEVSAADIQPITEKGQEKRPKDIKKDVKTLPVKVEAKKVPKTEIKPKAKPPTVKSETKVQPKKKEVKTVKSETKVEEKSEEIIVPVTEVVKPQPTPTEATTPVVSGFKPINYAAAAKANKPKKPSPPPATDKPTPALKTEKPKTLDKVEKKTAVKSEKPVIQRKNSAK